MAYVYSTLTADQEYAVYPKDLDFQKIPKPERKILIHGGSNVINKNFITPRGVVTTVTDEQLKVLNEIPAFKKHIEKGFIEVSNKKEEPGKVAKNMTPKDKGAQLEAGDFETDKQPKVNKAGESNAV